MTIGLSRAWYIIYKEINMMFQNDDAVKVVYDDESKTVSVYVNDTGKAEALDALLRHEYIFGNVTLKVNVISPNNDKYEKERKYHVQSLKEQMDIPQLFKLAFNRNPVFSDVIVLPSAILGGWTYVLFAAQPVQFYTDDLSCWRGYKTKLLEDIARDIFEPRSGVSFCTVVERS